jgi:hypothetical protein
MQLGNCSLYLKTLSSLFLDKDRTMDNVQKHNICTNVPLVQTLDLINCSLIGLTQLQTHTVYSIVTDTTNKLLFP